MSNQDVYRIKISPETIKGSKSIVEYEGVEVGVYSAMTQVLTSGVGGTSTLTGLTIPILLRETSIDSGYYSPFDGAIMQKDAVTNFVFSSTTESPYTYYILNTSGEYKKFVELSNYRIDWGDGSPIVEIGQDDHDVISHTYPSVTSKFNITLTQNNPWGINKITKTISTPYSNVEIENKSGTAYFTPLGGNWESTPTSYDYIFSGDSTNDVEGSISSNYISVPFTVSGYTKSRVNELSLYREPKFQIGVPVINNGQIWGVITNMTEIYTAYTINDINYFDYSDGNTIYFVKSSGFTDNNIESVAIVKDEMLLKMSDQPQIQSNIFIERGKNSAYERILRMGEIRSVEGMVEYGYRFFNVEKKN
jgi:hypothetical protein